MCGFCIESIQLKMLDCEKQGKRIPEIGEPSLVGAYLQEANDLLAGMDKVRNASRRKKVVPLHLIPSEVLVCRAIDILLGEGFNSPLYQKLLRSRSFQQAVADACSPEKYAALDALPPDFRITNLSCFYQPEFFFYPAASESLKKFKTFGIVRHECLELLRAYVRGRLREEWSMNQTTFTAGFRAVYASLALLGRFRSSKRLLWTIAEETPESPDLESYSLWLQHRAILQLHKHEGFAKIISRMAHLRSSLFWYLDLKIGLSTDQKEALRLQVMNLPGGDSVDNDFSIRTWLD